MIWLGDGITFLWRRDLQALPLSVEILYLGREEIWALIYVVMSGCTPRPKISVILFRVRA